MCKRSHGRWSTVNYFARRKDAGLIGQFYHHCASKEMRRMVEIELVTLAKLSMPWPVISTVWQPRPDTTSLFCRSWLCKNFPKAVVKVANKCDVSISSSVAFKILGEVLTVKGVLPSEEVLKGDKF